jgi:hypothetical protein
MNELAPIQIHSDVVQTTPMAMLNVAVARGDTHLAEKLMDLADRWDRTQARKAFDAAIAAAKATMPVINKNRAVDFTTQKGRTNYRFEDLAEIARTIDPILAANGLSYRFRTTSLPNEPITVTCIVSHREGHFEENTLSAGRDESGNKNSIQGIGSTITYLQRYTLKAALGLAASNEDDGRAAGNDGAITQAQVETLQQTIVDVGANIARFCGRYSIESVNDLPASKFADAMASLDKFASQQKAKSNA